MPWDSRRAAIFGWDDTGPLAILFAASSPRAHCRPAALRHGRDRLLAAAPTIRTAGPTLGNGMPGSLTSRHAGEARRSPTTISVSFAPSLASKQEFRRRVGECPPARVEPGGGDGRRAHGARDRRAQPPAAGYPGADARPQAGRDCTVLIRSTECRTSLHESPARASLSSTASDLLPWAGDSAALLRAMEDFLGEVHDEEGYFERVLATVMFTDIVGSTDARRHLATGAGGPSSKHHANVRAMLARFRGARSTRPATASSPPSTVLRAPSAARRDRRGRAVARTRDPRGRAHRRGRDDRR